MTIAWLPIVTFAVLIASMRWHKFSFYGHVFLALLVIGLTLGASIPMIIEVGLDGDDPLVQMHSYTGLVVVIWLGV